MTTHLPIIATLEEIKVSTTILLISSPVPEEMHSRMVYTVINNFLDRGLPLHKHACEHADDAEPFA